MAGFPQSNIDWSKYMEGLDSKANKNLSNLNIVTNCITEIPQDIKLELKDGVLTLKAGSKVYKPNGANTFEKVITDKDFTGLGWLANTDPHMIFYSYKNGNLDGQIFTQLYSGDSFPASPVLGTRCYRTDENKIYTYRTSTNKWELEDCLPLGIVRGSGVKGEVASIDQVFNGFGYIGSTVFALPGVKGLVPNGRNNDGTLKNIAFTLSKIILNTFGHSCKDQVTQLNINPLGIGNSSEFIISDQPPAKQSPLMWLDSLNNFMYRQDDITHVYNRRETIIIADSVELDKGKIVNISFRKPFQLLGSASISEGGTNFKIGDPIITLRNDLAPNEIWLEGATVSRTTYSELYKKYGVTYGAGDGSTTFTLPNFKGRALWGDSTLGYIGAGLPNITGWIGTYENNMNCSGNNNAFYQDGWSGNNTFHTNGGGGAITGIGFNASRVNAIYGKSNTVQPPAIKIRVKTRYK